jgi:steroid delta-isomerase-like uncharacterized protein
MAVTMEENKAVVRRFYDDVFTRGELDVLDELVAAAFAFTRPRPPPGGRAGLEQLASHGRAVFPDLRVVADELIAEGDRVVARWTASGTHTGAPYHGVPATGKAVTEVGVDIWRLADGRLAELWHLGDGLGLRRQFGLVAED